MFPSYLLKLGTLISVDYKSFPKFIFLSSVSKTIFPCTFYSLLPWYLFSSLAREAQDLEFSPWKQLLRVIVSMLKMTELMRGNAAQIFVFCKAFPFQALFSLFSIKSSLYLRKIFSDKIKNLYHWEMTLAY